MHGAVKFIGALIVITLNNMIQVYVTMSSISESPLKAELI